MKSLPWVLVLVAAFAVAPRMAAAARRNLASIVVDDGVIGLRIPHTVSSHASLVERLFQPDMAADAREVQRAFLASGLMADAIGDRAAAVSAWRRAGVEALWVGLSSRAWRAGHPEDAVAVLQRAIDIDPDNLDNYFGLAWLYSPGTGRIPEAVTIYHNVIARTAPGSFENALALGHVSRLHSDWQEAFAQFDRAARLRSDRDDAARFAAEMAGRIGKWPAAIDWLEQAQRASPKDSNIVAELGDAYREAGHLPEAAAAYQRAARQDPGNILAARGYASLAQRYVEGGRLDEARIMSEMALAANPGSADFRRVHAEILERLGQQARPAHD